MLGAYNKDGDVIGALLVEAIRAVLNEPPVTGDIEAIRIDALADAPALG